MNEAPTTLIRPAIAQDYESICRLFQALDEYHVRLAPRHYQAFDGPPRSRERFSALISKADHYFFVAIVGTEIVAFVNGGLGQSPPFPMFLPRTFVEVANLVVDASQRQRGIGRTLIQRVREWGEHREVDAVRLDVIGGNVLASRFYADLGFRQIRTTLEMDLHDPDS